MWLKIVLYFHWYVLHSPLLWSPLSFGCFVVICPWWIYTSMAYAFIYDSFSANMRSAMPCFLGNIIAYIISNSWCKIDRCYTLFCLSPRYIHTLCILIGLHLPYDFYAYPYHKRNFVKLLMRNWHCNRWYWPIHRLLWMAKYFWGSRFNKPL